VARDVDVADFGRAVTHVVGLAHGDVAAELLVVRFNGVDNVGQPRRLGNQQTRECRTNTVMRALIRFNILKIEELAMEDGDRGIV
jgi:hypothetical protein